MAADAATPDAQARFIAGMTVEATPLAAQASGSAAWQAHAKSFDKAWDELQKRQLDPIAGWIGEHIPRTGAADSPLYYMFSGPDFLYAHAFFPDAATYVMCGTEPVGAVPDIAAMNEEAVEHGLATIRKALDAVLSFSFFITKKMKEDLVQSQLTGTVPILYVFLARSGCRITDVKPVGLDNDGKLTEGKSKTPGVNIKFIGTGGRAQQLYYFTTDLSNWGIKDNPGFMRFCEGQGKGRGFAKAASYLMHSSHFTTVRDFLLNHTSSMVQDDSGIPLKDFPTDRWVVIGFGHYKQPIDLFKDKLQPDLVEMFGSGACESLPFSFGYTWKKNESSLLCAITLDNVPKAKPVKDGE